MNNNFQLIVVQNIDSYDIEVMFVAPKNLDSNIVKDYIFEIAEEHNGDIDIITDLVTKKFGLVEIFYSEQFA